MVLHLMNQKNETTSALLKDATSRTRRRVSAATLFTGPSPSMGTGRLCARCPENARAEGVRRRAGRGIPGPFGAGDALHPPVRSGDSPSRNLPGYGNGTERSSVPFRVRIFPRYLKSGEISPVFFEVSLSFSFPAVLDSGENQGGF